MAARRHRRSNSIGGEQLLGAVGAVRRQRRASISESVSIKSFQMPSSSSLGKSAILEEHTVQQEIRLTRSEVEGLFNDDAALGAYVREKFLQESVEFEASPNAHHTLALEKIREILGDNSSLFMDGPTNDTIKSPSQLSPLASPKMLSTTICGSGTPTGSPPPEAAVEPMDTYFKVLDHAGEAMYVNARTNECLRIVPEDASVEFHEDPLLMDDSHEDDDGTPMENAFTEYNIEIKVVEARGLPSVGFTGQCNPYLLIQADRNEKYKTATVSKSNKPFWRETASWTQTSPFKNVSLTLWHEPSGQQQSTVLGRISLTGARLLGDRTHEQWYAVAPIAKSADFYRGELKVEILRHQGMCKVKVIKAEGLPEGQQMFIQITCGGVIRRTEFHANDGHFYSFVDDDVFIFDHFESSITLSVWAARRRTRSTFIGQVDVLLSEVKDNNTWIPMHLDLYQRYSSRNDESLAVATSVGEVYGAIRMSVAGRVRHVLPLAMYEPLKALLVRHTCECINILDPLVDRAGFSRALVGLFASFGDDGRDLQLVHDLLANDVRRTSEVGVIFRGNTIATKTVDCYMKILGKKLLSAILKPVITGALSPGVSFEMNPMVVSPVEAATNGERLREFGEMVLRGIEENMELVPRKLRATFCKLKEECYVKWPTEDLVGHTSTVAFFFLRFLCPAILQPKLFDLWPDLITGDKGRTLTLLAKTVQNLANLVEFGKKEPYMESMNPWIVANKERIKGICEELSTYPEGEMEDMHVNSTDNLSERQLSARLMDYLVPIQLKLLEADAEGSPDVKTALVECVGSISDLLLFVDEEEEAEPLGGSKSVLTLSGNHSVAIETMMDSDDASEDKFHFIDKMRTALSKGCTFTKHSKWKRDRLVHVYCVLTDRKVYWGPADRHDAKPEGSIKFSDVTGILRGCLTPTMQKHRRATPAHCFSIISVHNSTLDLEATSEDARDWWVQAFTFLLAWQGSPAQESGLKGIDLRVLADPDNFLRKLMVAASKGDQVNLLNLLQMGVDANGCAPNSTTPYARGSLRPLHAAAAGGHKDVVKVLLEAGAKDFETATGDTALSLAEARGFDDIVKLLQ